MTSQDDEDEPLDPHLTTWSGRPHLYILNSEGEPVPVEDVLLWGKWFETADRIVAQTEVPGGVMGGPPVLWETMGFMDGNSDHETDRYTSYADAVKGHQAIVEKLSGRRKREQL